MKPDSALAERTIPAEILNMKGLHRTKRHSDMKKLLIVDDEPQVLSLVSSVAKAMEYEVIQAQDGLEALLAHGQNPDINALVTDIRMPGVNGFQLAQALREKIPDLPILFISGYYDRTDEEFQTLAATGTYFLAKPFTLQQLGSGLLLLFANELAA
ncbi:MAG: Signal transduction histidine kinase regulating C4-dicarboxylate transport system [Fibrobacteres bacterium]|nr:Signal transduction histidine kinase regulating C4-dicarboxylate transport system [Fibrobacterota bacterium]